MARKRTALETFSTGTNLRWDVRWVYKPKSERWRIAVKEFGSNLPGAIVFYEKVKSSGGKRHFVTLRCRNSGFPPPEELQPHWVKKKVKKRVKGKLRTVLEDRYRSPMLRRNREGVWWCPYCMELREFVKPYELPYEHPWHTVVGDMMPKEPGLYCPMCLVGTNNMNVRRWNPLAERISY